ncbi:AraC family transcriptional regulator [Amorphoplanes nipponensis]|uniref:AraC family transcriptional regulator n=1 Tax=Actinoplanes nipponensis TaxID=135950 RepID=A0A919JBU3_9ACTN|nr:helix-turn-helix domain-containing protein [Actinoplanes nipponensis]GIE47501.1 AraC family transcriptional regulator [Actinoplanes nipponensis]
MARDARELRGAWATFQSHWYGVPSADLAPFVSGYWAAEWDLRGQPPYRQKIVPYPHVHLTFRDGDAVVRGPERRYAVRVLEGRGRVFGVKFRPGCFRPFLGDRVSTITGRVLPAAAVFGPGRLPIPSPSAEGSFEEASQHSAGRVEEFLRQRLPAPDPLAERAAGIVTLVRDEPGLTRVDALAGRAGLGVRRLQRLFAEYVGLGPKWVIRRYRLHEVGERLAAGAEIDWAGLAGELGYADQAHFVRDFTAMVGEPPTRYAARYPGQGDGRH